MIKNHTYYGFYKMQNYVEKNAYKMYVAFLLNIFFHLIRENMWIRLYRGLAKKKWIALLEFHVVWVEFFMINVLRSIQLHGIKFRCSIEYTHHETHSICIVLKHYMNHRHLYHRDESFEHENTTCHIVKQLGEKTKFFLERIKSKNYHIVTCQLHKQGNSKSITQNNNFVRGKFAHPAHCTTYSIHCTVAV